VEDVARAADISRPGLYLYFPSKQELFRAAVTHALDRDVAAAERTLVDTARPLRDRLIDACDQWTGRYVGPLARDVAVLIENNPDLLGPLVAAYPGRFATLVTDAIAAELAAERGGMTRDVARTLLSMAYGDQTRGEHATGLPRADDYRHRPAPAGPRSRRGTWLKVLTTNSCTRATSRFVVGCFGAAGLALTGCDGVRCRGPRDARQSGGERDGNLAHHARSYRRAK